MATNVAKAARHANKYTVQPSGLGALINRIFAVDWRRSTGVPLNPQYRNPPPGALDPTQYTDAVTVPAADLADNPYWKRDVRRRYPKLSTVTQGDVVALLSVGSKAAPRDDVLQLGDAGKNQIVVVQKEGEAGGLAVFLEKESALGKNILAEGGMPPFPPGGVAAKPYKLISKEQQSYEGNYPCRTFE
ncbi:putative NADH-ubiquinone oxidoreductase 21 kDa subunit [Tothia fuscella]|uniref:NADH-ubiquinone oxidoreductase 21 kDa subunit n=1 Tax=Tothia fuscella TaxID=1048955 RepID=A0A9P4NK45_9PEZI|nr:putative NADH-ubiquinone oxidoreductase 21 kDa subunit [Tothia fuscella]